MVRNSGKVEALAYKHAHIHSDHNVYGNAVNVFKHLRVYFHKSIGKLVVIGYFDSKQYATSCVTVIIQEYLIVKQYSFEGCYFMLGYMFHNITLCVMLKV